jgi:formyltetrahydrofolate deformylase
MSGNKYILTLSCADQIGIVAAVSGFLAAAKCNILESAQFNDETTGKFFMRVVFAAPTSFEAKSFESVASKFAMTYEINDTAKKPNLLLLVSKSSHCLNHLLHKRRIGSLNANIPVVASNHPDLRDMAEWHKIPFVQMNGNDEAKILELVAQHNIDLVVLARYMQILSPATSAKLKGKAINIHHSFLPSFKGANPYKQAFDRGVKIIGATAHYVTDALDEGPIIDQEVIRVDHTMTADQLRAAGSDIENLVLARAVQMHLEHRVLLNGNKTVVFK